MRERGERLDISQEESYRREYNLLLNYVIGRIAELQNVQAFLPEKAKRRIKEFESRRDNIFNEWMEFDKQEKTSEEKIKVLKSAISMLKELHTDIKNFDDKHVP